MCRFSLLSIMPKVYVTLGLLATLMAVASAQVSGWTSCGTPMADIKQVYLTGCTEVPCIVTRGVPSEISFEAIAVLGNERLNYRVTASLLGIPITLHEGTACNSIFYGYCPIRPAERFVLGLRFTVGHDVPQVSSTILFRLFSDRGEGNGPDDICFTVPIQIRA